MRTGNVTDCPPPTITAGGSSSVKEPEDSGLSQYTASAPAAARAGSSHRNRGQCRGGSGACQSPTSFSPCRDVLRLRPPPADTLAKVPKESPSQESTPEPVPAASLPTAGLAITGG